MMKLELIKRYDHQGPRYTSYPSAVQFNTEYGSREYIAHAQATNEDLIPRPLSLYVHIPFCSTVCYYCACNKIVTNNRAHADHYLSALYTEIAMQGQLYDRDRLVEQLHWGGGTPTFLSLQQMTRLMTVIREHFSLLKNDAGDYSIEIDPRECNEETLWMLRDLGFNRISFGVQDSNERVQKAINRLQPFETTAKAVQSARKIGFKSINLDLVYGLPQQTLGSFAETLDQVLSLSADRLAVYNYAHLPQLFKVQKQIKAKQLPTPDAKLNMLQAVIEKVTNAGYIYIGMDHFAKPDDELATAQRLGKLHRNFQGYSTRSDCELVGLGVSSIGKVAYSYAQNERKLSDYISRIKQHELPIFRGITLDFDDILRRTIITDLICNFQLDIKKLEQKFGIVFQNYFAHELERLRSFREDDLLYFSSDILQITPYGRLLVRNICMLFDKYIKPETQQLRFSKLI